MGRSAPFRKFHPGTFQSDDQVKAQFVVRFRELDMLLEIVLDNVEAVSCQHALVVAPRGRGKTMLLARVAAELRTNQVYSERLLPVRLMEESQEIFDIADFWLDALLYLSRECARFDGTLARELRDTHASLSERWRDGLLGDHARSVVVDAADRLGRQLVLMVENLQELCKNVGPDFGWELRQALQTETRIMLLASATSRFAGLDDPRQPFFELFRVVDLPPLDADACGRLWRTVGDGSIAHDMRPLQILTGGNPRLIVIAAGFARHRSPRRLMEELVGLIDDHTEYFRSHLESFAKTERRVYLAVIDLWQPSTASEVATRARMDIRPVSTLLGRLVQRGAVGVERVGRKRLYFAIERLYSIYYKLRRDREDAALVNNLIRFMAAFYSEGKLEQLSDELAAAALEWDTASGEFGTAFGASTWLETDRSPGTMPRGVNVEVEPVLDGIVAAHNARQWEAVLELADSALASHHGGSLELAESVLALVSWSRAYALSELGDPTAASQAFVEIIDRLEGAEAATTRAWLCRAWVHKGIAEQRTGDTVAAVATMREAVRRFGDSDEPDVQKQLALALVTRAHWLERPRSVVEACDEVVARFGDSELPYVREGVALSLRIKGLAFRDLGEPEAELAVCDDIVERFGDAGEQSLEKHVSSALLAKQDTQMLLGNLEEAIATCDLVIERFADSEVGETRTAIATAWLAKLGMLIWVMPSEAVLRDCEELERSFGHLLGGVLRWRLGWVRAKALAVGGKREASVEAFRGIHAALDPGNQAMVRDLQVGVCELVAAGVSEQHVLEVLLSERDKSMALAPLLVALRKRVGETVRAPMEVSDVARDIDERIEAELSVRRGRSPSDHSVSFR